MMRMLVNFSAVLTTVKKRWPMDKLVVVVALVLGAALFLFTKLSLAVSGGATLELDNQILTAVRDPQNKQQLLGPTWLLPATRDITALGGVAVTTLLTLLVTAFFALRKKWRLLLFFLASVGGGTGTMLIMKYQFHRARPTVVPILDDVSNEAYPSGHSMISAIVYLTLGAFLAKSSDSRRLRLYYFSVALFLTLVIGLSRIALAAHYPSDVLAGWSLGVTWSCTSYLLVQMLQKRGVIEKPGNPNGSDDKVKENGVTPK